MFIYKITNLINGKIYVGQTKLDINLRFRQHFKPSSGCTILVSAIKKYGKENFSVELLEEIEKVDLNSKEKYWINKLNSLTPNGYNIVEGGNKGPTKYGKDNFMFGKIGKLHPQYGTKRTNFTKELISSKVSGKNNGMYGIRGKFHPSSKKIFCTTLNIHYDSIQEACRDLKLDPSAVVRVLKNKSKSHKKYKFIYLEE